VNFVDEIITVKEQYHMNPQKPYQNTDSRDPQTYAIIGAAMEVHRRLGTGFLEAVYQHALAFEFSSRSIPFAREVELPVYYKGERLDCSYRADFVCYNEVIVELKALKSITGVEEGQLINYLKATGLKRGLLLNFGSANLELKRLVFTQSVDRAK
jgi:GxxExxY protein